MSLLDLIFGTKHKKKERHVERRDVNLSQTVVDGTTAVLFQFQVPSKAILVLKKFANYTDIVGAWGTLTWRILKNGIGVYPYDDIEDEIGYSAMPENITNIEFRGGDLCVINAENLSGADLIMGIRLVYELVGY